MIYQNEDRESRLKNIRPLNRDLKDLRLYLHFDLKRKDFYLLQAADIYFQHLIWNGLKCPNYNHIYIYTGNTTEEAISEVLTPESWHAAGIATLDEKSYKNGTPRQREQLVLNAIESGLRDIAKLDHLDPEIIEKSIQKARETGFEHEFIIAKKENKKFHAEATYKILKDGHKVQPFLYIKNKETKETKTIKLKVADSIQLGWWIMGLTVTNKEIRVKSSKAATASVWLEGLEPNPVFKTEGLFEKN